MNLLFKMYENHLNKKIYLGGDIECSQLGVISFHSQVPKSLNEAMKTFIENHPNWDQYRIIQAALSGFLLQNGIESRQLNTFQQIS